MGLTEHDDMVSAVPCQSWVGFTIGTFEFECPTGTRGRLHRSTHALVLNQPVREALKGRPSSSETGELSR